MVGSSVMLKIENISKSFGAVHALKDVSFSINKGEIHALLGENGAGKSTLIKILSGEYTPDSGTILVDNKKITVFHPSISRLMGMSVVHQELSIFENLAVYENIFPFNKDNKVIIPKSDLIKKTTESMKRFNLSISPDAKMADLQLPVQQMVEILRAISNDAKIVLLDEPSSGLNLVETSNLMRILKQLRDEGITIIYISHHISEIIEISDRITVLKDGSYVSTFINDHNLTESILISSMVGRDFEQSIYSKKKSIIDNKTEIIMEVRNFSKTKIVKDVSLHLRKGEILGIYGLEGSGNFELSRMLFGIHSKDSGTVRVHDKSFSKITPIKMIGNKILYLNNNRKYSGLFFNMSIADNMAAPVLDRLTYKGILSKNKMKDYATFYVDKFSIVLNSIFDTPITLSGGNQQKIMLSICLGPQPQILIVNDPTRGIDINAKQDIIKFLNEIANHGVSIICFSSDLPELITLSDRLAVMNSGYISGVLNCDEINEKSVMELAATKIRKGQSK